MNGTREVLDCLAGDCLQLKHSRLSCLLAHHMALSLLPSVVVRWEPLLQVAAPPILVLNLHSVYTLLIGRKEVFSYKR